MNKSKWMMVLLCVLFKLSAVFGIGVYLDPQESQHEDDDYEFKNIKEMMQIGHLVDVLKGLHLQQILAAAERSQIRRPVPFASQLPVRGKKAISLFTHWRPFKPRPPSENSSDKNVRNGLTGRSSRPLGQPLRWGRR